MIKIPTIFKRDYKTFKVIDKINPECQWVFDNEGIAYRKWQGMAAMIKDSTYYKRVILKDGYNVPNSFILTFPDYKANKFYGWLPVDFSSKEDKYYIEAYDQRLPNGTYELIGPKIHRNKDKVPNHILMSHKAYKVSKFNLSYIYIKKMLHAFQFEGIVFHHPDGRMAKIKLKDFGLYR